MTLVTPETDALGLEELFESVQRQLMELRHELEAFKEEARSGEEFKPAEVKAALARLKTLVGQCTGLEKTLAECRQKQTGIALGGYALDLEAARSEIGCALNRIRVCCRAGEISE
jgi:phage-related minor tail protein